MVKTGNIFNLTSFLSLCFFVFFVATTFIVNAQDFTSSAYKVMDPVVDSGGEFATSSNFQLWSTIAEVAVGTSSSVGYNVGGGFLRFPFVTVPSASSSPGDSYVRINWTTSVGYLGWTVTSYSIGYSTTSSGPYTYENKGNVNTGTISGLTNGTPYYFVVTVNDFFGNVIATSTEVVGTPIYPSIIFSISANTIYFGELNPSFALFASSTNVNGSTAEVEAHALIVKTNASNGYTLTVRGKSLTSQQNQLNVITPIGGTNTAPAPGNRQFGLRAVASGGLGIVASPYSDAGFAYDASATTSSSVGTASTGDNATTTYSVRYVGNRDGLTEAGSYATDLVYIATANF